LEIKEEAKKTPPTDKQEKIDENNEAGSEGDYEQIKPEDSKVQNEKENDKQVINFSLH